MVVTSPRKEIIENRLLVLQAKIKGKLFMSPATLSGYQKPPKTRKGGATIAHKTFYQALLSGKTNHLGVGNVPNFLLCDIFNWKVASKSTPILNVLHISLTFYWYKFTWEGLC